MFTKTKSSDKFSSSDIIRPNVQHLTSAGMVRISYIHPCEYVGCLELECNLLYEEKKEKTKPLHKFHRLSFYYYDGKDTLSFYLSYTPDCAIRIQSNGQADAQILVGISECHFSKLASLIMELQNTNEKVHVKINDEVFCAKDVIKQFKTLTQTFFNSMKDGPIDEEKLFKSINKIVASQTALLNAKNSKEKEDKPEAASSPRLST